MSMFTFDFFSNIPRGRHIDVSRDFDRVFGPAIREAAAEARVAMYSHNKKLATVIPLRPPVLPSAGSFVATQLKEVP